MDKIENIILNDNIVAKSTRNDIAISSSAQTEYEIFRKNNLSSLEIAKNEK